ncbi:TIGR00266 family protein [Candidatus Undinarchaeota archaeon]
MKVKKQFGPAYTSATVTLAPNESIQVEGGAMMSHSPNVQMATHMRDKSFLKSLKVAALGSESLFLNTFTAKNGEGEVTLAPAFPGDINTFELNGNGYIIQSGAYMANEPGIDIDTKWQGLKGALSEGDMIFLYAKGTGKVILASFGAMDAFQLKPGEEYIVDTGHLVAFEDTITYDVELVKGMKSLLLSGEGIVTRIHGPGWVITQSRSIGQFISWLRSYLPSSSSQSHSNRGGVTFGV